MPISGCYSIVDSQHPHFFSTRLKPPTHITDNKYWSHLHKKEMAFMLARFMRTCRLDDPVI